MAGYKYHYLCPTCHTHLIFKMRVTQTQRKCPQCGRKVTPEEIDKQQDARDAMNQVREEHNSKAILISALIAVIIAFPFHGPNLISVACMAFIYWIPIVFVVSIIFPLFSNVEKKASEAGANAYLGNTNQITSACPHCSSQIFDFTITPGDNICPHCRGHFSIDT